MLKAIESFLQLRNIAQINYSIADSHRKLTFLSKKSREATLQRLTGVHTENFFYQLLEELKCSQLVECGAHDAAVSRLFTEVTKGVAIAFEASPLVWEKYQKINETGKVDYINLGLSKEKSIMNLNIPLHSLHYSTKESSLEMQGKLENYQQVQIQVETLDHLVTDFVKSDNTAFWIDVEGHEFKVLEGARKVLELNQSKIIYIEVQEDSSYFQSAKYAFEVAEYLEGCGFVAIACDNPVDSLFNCIFIRKDDLGRLLPLITKYWAEYANLKVPHLQLTPPRDVFSSAKRWLVSSKFVKLNFILDLFFSKLGSKSSQQKIATYRSNHKK